MVASNVPRPVNLEDFGVDPEYADAAGAALQRNWSYFVEHQQELFEQYQDTKILIHSSGCVVASDDIQELIEARNSLDAVEAAGAFKFSWRQGVRIGSVTQARTR